MTDWNWFFSSVAQSIAAVVGIMAGFLTTRLVTHQAEFHRRQSQTADLLSAAQRLTDDAARRRFDRYNQARNALAQEKVRSSLLSNANQEAIDLYKSIDFSPYETVDVLLPEIQERIDAVKNGVYNVGSGYTENAHATFRAEVLAEEEKINEVLAACRQHLRAVSQHVNHLERQPESPPVIRTAIAATLLLFWIGVVYPLSFLPVTVGAPIHLAVGSFVEILFSLRGAILGVSTVVFSVAGVAALVLNHRLRYSHAQIQDLRRYSSEAAYSPFFAIMQANAKIRGTRAGTEA